MPLDLSDVLAKLQLGDHRDVIADEWTSSMETLPDALPFLDEPFVRGGCDYAALPEEIADEAVAAARLIADRPALRALLWHAHRRLHELRTGVAKWPLPTEAMGERAGMFFLLALISAWPRTRDFHQAHGIPRDIVEHTMTDVLTCMRWFRRHFIDAWGLEESRTNGWLMHHVRGELYRLGRLQYMPRPLFGGFVALRRRDDSTMVVMADDGLKLRADGRRNGAQGVTETEGVWTATLAETREAFVGHPVDPATATVRREPVALPRADWRVALASGDTCLDMHIPAGDPLDHAACGASMRRARAFFPAHFPDLTFEGFCCTSWLFDPTLETLLPEASNLVRFLREFYLLPAVGDGGSGFRFVFDLAPDRTDYDVAQLPRDSTLRRGMIDHVAAGGRMGKTGALMLTDHLDRWGEQVYRGAWMEDCSRETGDRPCKN